jgi:hypothetical protein
MSIQAGNFMLLMFSSSYSQKIRKHSQAESQILLYRQVGRTRYFPPLRPWQKAAHPDCIFPRKERAVLATNYQRRTGHILEKGPHIFNAKALLFRLQTHF